jgi:hypothetical protein
MIGIFYIEAEINSILEGTGRRLMLQQRAGRQVKQ